MVMPKLRKVLLEQVHGLGGVAWKVRVVGGSSVSSLPARKRIVRHLLSRRHKPANYKYTFTNFIGCGCGGDQLRSLTRVQLVPGGFLTLLPACSHRLCSVAVTIIAITAAD